MRLTKRLPDGQAIMTCDICEIREKSCSALNCRNRLKDALAQYEDADDVEQMPTVDAVPVVRCKDCKYWGDEAGVAVRTDGVRFARCKEHNLCVSGERIGWCPTEDDFCSQGERRESNADR